jgi:adenosylhomocysteinase
MQQNIVARPELAAEGQRKIEWVRRNMPILRQLEAQFAVERPFAGKRIAICVHLEAKTAYLALVLRARGSARPRAARRRAGRDAPLHGREPRDRAACRH